MGGAPIFLSNSQSVSPSRSASATTGLRVTAAVHDVSMTNMLAQIPSTATGRMASRGISFRSRIKPLPSKPIHAGWGSRSARARGSRVLRVACDEKAASWVDAWKKRDAERKTTEAQADATEKPPNPIFAKRFERAQQFHYVYVCDTGVEESDVEVRCRS